MATTKFDICSQALTKCGADTISSFADGTHESNVCSVMYDTIKKSLLYYTFWNFAVTKVQLNRLSETPSDKKFLYVFSLPADIIRIRSTFDQIVDKYKLTVTIDDVPSYHVEIVSHNKSNNENLLEEINHLLLEESKTKRMIYSKKEIISNIQKI